ncbi:MAG: hemolysin family protein [Chitinophagaceae bacterium]|jgi:putative hemolysin|nr:hemolysin family protein [Chitinophagaceae bacterium]
MTELFILIFLIILNGFFSMCELALVSSRKSRIEQLASQGSKNALAVLALIEKPEVFLSTIQVGITLVAILTGLYSGERFGTDLQGLLEQVAFIKPYATTVSKSIVVILVTYFSILLGELIPKKIALVNAEPIAMAVAPFMSLLSRLAFPIIWSLNNASSLIFRIFNIRDSSASSVTEEEIKALVIESAESGEIDEKEQEIIERVFHLGDRSITSLMTHRSDIVWLDMHGYMADLLVKMQPNPHSVYPLCDGTIDEIKGILQLKDVILADKTTELKTFLKPAVFVPENISPYKMMERFRQTKIHSAFIVDEYGTLQGMITLNDILEAIVGDIPEQGDDEYEIVQRKDGSFLVDAQLPFYDFLARFDKEDWMDEEQEFDTLGGFIIHHLERIPVTGDTFEWRGFYFEIVDMDGVRIDKILVTNQNESTEDPPTV